MSKRTKKKKALIRIIEVVISILIITSALLILMSRNNEGVSSDDIIYEKHREILNLISKNENLRYEIIGILNTNLPVEDNVAVNGYIKELIPGGWRFETKICGLQDICSQQSSILDREVYSTEIIITSTLDEFSPKKLRLFSWFG
jgi:hypothetical protein